MGVQGKIILLAFISMLSFSCNKEPEITESMLDGEVIFDPSLYNPEKYLVSYSDSFPTETEKDIPVLIACHGYSASTFEWDELRSWQGNRTDFRISQVLLDGHGRTYDDFKNSSWKDWQSAILREYDRLVKQGYRHIDFATSSASCALLLEILSSHYFDNKVIPRHLFMVDPFIIPGDKNLTMVNVMGPMIGYVEVENTPGEDAVYYHFRPYETLKQLQDMAIRVRKKLEDGIILPPGCELKVYKSERDATADPVSAVLIHKGMQTYQGNRIEVEMFNSSLHVFTRLGLRNNTTAKDLENQVKAFEDITLRSIR